MEFMDFVRAALNGETLPPLNGSLTPDQREIAASLRFAVAKGGEDDVRRVWQAIVRNRPDLEINNPFLHQVSWIHQVTEISLPRYLIDDYPFYEAGINVLVGRPGARKSLAAIDFLARAAAVDQDSKYLYVAYEGFAGILARWKAWEKHYKVELPNVGVLRGGVEFGDLKNISQFGEFCKESGVRFVVMDTFADATIGLNENDSKDMSQFFGSAYRLMEDGGLGLLFIHHTNKQDRYRGSSVILGKADSMVHAVVDDEGVVTLYNSGTWGGKNKDRPEAAPIHKRAISVKIVTDGEMDDVAVLEDADKVMDDPDILPEGQLKVLETLKGFPAGLRASELIDATGMSRSSVYHALKRLQGRKYVLADMDRYTLSSVGEEAL